MSLARTSPTLRMRITQQQAWTTIPADTAGATRPRRVTSYSELYRGTEYDTRVQAPAMPAYRQGNRGREFVLLAFAALACVGAATLLALLG